MTTTGRCCWAGLMVLWCSAYCANAGSPPTVRLERVPEGGVQPQVLVDSSGTLHLVYLKGDPKACDVMYTLRRAGQTDFSKPLRVNSKPGSAIAIGTVRGAQMALGRNGRVHVVWNGSDLASTKASGGSPMLYSRLADSGHSFESQRDLMTSTTHLDGGGSVAADEQGHVYVVWHGHKTTGPQEEIDRGVFVAASSDDGRTLTPERQVNPPETGACGCCGLKAFAANGGSLGILYRSANLRGNRDSVLLLSTNYGSTFESKVLGEWHVSPCPMSTHELGPRADGMAAMWEKEGQVYLESILPGQLESARDVVPSGSTGNRKHPTFASGTSKSSPVLIAWTEGTGWEKGGSLAWECLDSSGAQMLSGRIDGVPVWSFGAAAAVRDGSFVLFY